VGIESGGNLTHAWSGEGGVGIESRETRPACEEETEGGVEIKLRGT